MQKSTKSKLFYCLVFQSAKNGDDFPGRVDKASWDNYIRAMESIVGVLYSRFLCWKGKTTI